MPEIKPTEICPDMIMEDNCDIEKNFQDCVFYGQTVLASPDSLTRLPPDIIKIWNQYQEGALPSSSPEEVSHLLHCWFENHLDKIRENGRVCEFSIDSSSSDFGFLPSELQKRRRVDGNF